jgi:protoheme ferro-lyase
MVGNVNISIALTMFMGLASGGLLSLVLMSTRRQQTSFSVMFGLTLLLAFLGAFGSASGTANLTAGLATGMVILVLSFALGYTLTTYSVLSTATERGEARKPGEHTGTIAVILLAQGEPSHYDVRSAARRLELADDRADVPPALLRPFYMRDLKGKYEAIGKSPSRDYYLQLADKVQSRMDSRHKVYAAFYSDQPTYREAVRRAVEEGAGRIVVAHVRVSDPPDAVLSGELLEGLRLERREVGPVHVTPLWDSSLLPQIYVRQIMESTAQAPDQADEVGLLLVGRGHPLADEASAERMEQEEAFIERVREVIIKLGFPEWRVRAAWLRHGSPTISEALNRLIESGCKSVYWMPATFIADGINTLYDIPAQMEGVAAQHNLKLISLGAWNGDSLAAQEIASRVRAVSREPVPA